MVVRAMRNVLVASCLLICGCAHTVSSKPIESMVGPWQFQDRAVWILVQTDGSTLQCRYASSDTTFKSKGKFVSPNSIHWNDIWGTDRVTVENGEMTLSGKWGKFTYRQSAFPMHETCHAAGQ